MEKIGDSPMLGSGFGATVTYKTEDPRILGSNPTGKYTTYAFEWGWLDIWLKLGLFGLLSYGALLAAVARAGFTAGPEGDDAMIGAAFAIGLAVISAVSFFSPYSNHPLGIGYLIIAGIIIENGRLKSA
jgi:O-antigen ligase